MNNNKLSYKITELPELLEQFTGNEFIEISTPIENDYLSKKNTSLNLGNWLGNFYESNNLETQNKTIINSINELNSMKGNDAGYHNSIYRGKWLGAAPTQKQYEAIYNGTFDDLYVGDFWSENPSNPNYTRWRIAGFNYYLGSGDTVPVTTNHAVIIPDVALNTIGDYYDEGQGAFGGYKYSYCRGYDHKYEEKITTEENQLLFHTDYIPDYINFVYSSILLDSNVLCYLLWEVDTTQTGEDPNNPGHGIVAIKGGNYYTIMGGWNLTSKPSFNGIPIGQGVKISYKHYNSSCGSFNTVVKPIIFDTFGEEHIMHHQIPLNVQKIYGQKQGVFVSNGSFIKSWTDVTMELPTAECILGNSDMTSYNEYMRYTSAKQKSDAQMYGYDNSSYNINFTNPPLNSPETHLELAQLPLFNYDPSLIHTRQGYYFRNLRTTWYLKDYRDSNNMYFPYTSNYNIPLEMDGNGFVRGTPRNDAGIRPIFCISAISEPNILLS